MPNGSVMSYDDFVDAVKEHFAPAWYEPRVVSFFLILASVLLIIFIFKEWHVTIPTARPNRKKTPIKPRDREFFRQIIVSKRLESFDEETLLEVSQDLEISPPYQILINKEEFLKAIKLLEIQEVGKTGSLKSNSKLSYLKRIQKKLFAEN
ncbi:MAG: hypothetical protein HQM08_22145 [Candidatus Riflebacteria bacterium]|nr:hypothetical protein [Candidatus Riflebacteria bacterium]